MKLLAINGSPRKKGNTAQLLEKVMEGAASKGADTELVHLYDLKYNGCIGCFQCKEIGGKSFGRCSVKDELSPLLQNAHEAEVIVLGSPFYFGTETAQMRAFLERFLFHYTLFSKIKPFPAPNKKATALLYTMGLPQDKMDEFGVTSFINNRTKSFMERVFGACEIFLSCDTRHFADYSKYDTDVWDVSAKLKRHEEVFPKELEQAYDFGVKLVS